MDIVYKNTADLKPYDKNTKKHDKTQIANVAESIKQYGFVQPIVIDANNVVVIGHCRLEASKKLKLKEVPCVCADDLTPEQINALRIVDNKTNESAWDFKFLEQEVPDIDLSMFDFDLDLDIEKFNTQHEKNINKPLEIQKKFNILEFDEYRAESFYEMPTLKAVDFKPTRLVGFNYAKTAKDFNCGIHFYLDDYQFERVWNDYEKYIDILSKFECVLTPHYSVYSDMAKPIKIYNTYRGKLLGQIMQDRGLTVIPTVYWGDEDSYDYSFAGLPEYSTLSTYTVNYNLDEYAHDMTKKGLIELLKRKKPKKLLLYGNGITIDDVDFGDCEVIYYKNEVTERMTKK